jgi:signal transduction histidine kinase
LALKDNGPGIPDDVQSRMFDPFFTTKPPGQGTGLGLSVTRRLMQDARGSIVVESRVGEGCCIRLKFPHY